MYTAALRPNLFLKGNINKQKTACANDICNRFKHNTTPWPTFTSENNIRMGDMYAKICQGCHCNVISTIAFHYYYYYYYFFFLWRIFLVGKCSSEKVIENP